MRATHAENEPEGRDRRPTLTDGGPVAASPGSKAPAGRWAVPIAGLAFGPDAGSVLRHGEPKDPLGGSPLSPDIAGVLALRRGRGEPLPADIAGSMGEAMGADLDDVRIHTGSEPARLARSVQATAFTQGTDIYFGAGAYAPQTPVGQRLLAHELAHTVQQGTTGGPGAGPIIGRAADPAEAEADRVADGVLRVLRRQPDRQPTDEPGDMYRAVRRSASSAVLGRSPAPTAAARPSNPPVSLPRPTPLHRVRSVQRTPADFAKIKTSTLNLPTDRGFFSRESTLWDTIVKATGDYAALKVDQLEDRAKALTEISRLILAWVTEHKVTELKVSGQKLNDADSAKDVALKSLKVLIEKEHVELMAPRFQGEQQLELAVKGWKPLKAGDEGMHVTRVQQALADTSHLAPNEVTGKFGASTVAAVKSFQQAGELADSGMVDQPTILELQRIFRGHTVELALATAPKVEPRTKPGLEPGEYKWGSAPTELMAGTRSLKKEAKAGKPVAQAGIEFVERPLQLDQWAAQDAVKTSQPASRTFVPDLPDKGTYEARLKDRLLRLVELYYDDARGKAAKRKKSDEPLDWDQIERVAARSKQVTDAVFGKFAVGPPMRKGAGIHDAWDKRAQDLQQLAPQVAAANWRVGKMLTGSETIRVLDLEHGAIQTRDAEKAIVERVQEDVVIAKLPELLAIHQEWEAFSEGGEVFIQRIKDDKVEKNRDVMWELFQTVVHEYIHTLEHSRHRKYRSGLEQQGGDFTLREGVVDYFAHTVLESVTYDKPLRDLVEGNFRDVSGGLHPIPKYKGYKERVHAEKLAGVVGARNVMAAFFLGDVEKIGY